MKKFKSTINEKSASFKTNKDAMLKLIDKLESNLKLSKVLGNEVSLKKANDRGKSLASERIEKILDKNSDFLELMPLAGLKHQNGFGPGGTTISGIGYVCGKPCIINSNIGTKKGGARK